MRCKSSKKIRNRSAIKIVHWLWTMFKGLEYQPGWPFRFFQARHFISSSIASVVSKRIFAESESSGRIKWSSGTRSTSALRAWHTMFANKIRSCYRDHYLSPRRFSWPENPTIECTVLLGSHIMLRKHWCSAQKLIKVMGEDIGIKATSWSYFPNAVPCKPWPILCASISIPPFSIQSRSNTYSIDWNTWLQLWLGVLEASHGTRKCAKS